MRCRDFFVHLHKDAAGDHWEFDRETWAGIAAEPLRYRICNGSRGAVIMTGCVDTDTNEIVWMEIETEGTLELAMLNVVDRVFSEAGGFERSDSSTSEPDSAPTYPDGDSLDLAVMDAPSLPRHRTGHGRRRGRKQRLISVQQWMEASEVHAVLPNSKSLQ